MTDKKIIIVPQEAYGFLIPRKSTSIATFGAGPCLILAVIGESIIALTHLSSITTSRKCISLILYNTLSKFHNEKFKVYLSGGDPYQSSQENRDFIKNLLEDYQNYVLDDTSCRDYNTESVIIFSDGTIKECPQSIINASREIIMPYLKSVIFNVFEPKITPITHIDGDVIRKEFVIDGIKTSSPDNFQVLPPTRIQRCDNFQVHSIEPSLMRIQRCDSFQVRNYDRNKQPTNNKKRMKHGHMMRIKQPR